MPFAEPQLKINAPIIGSEPVRVRIAPSPTGFLHLGTARTALFNFLFARKHHGIFILRIEDTDLERSDPKFEKDIIEELRWLGIVWDEGIEAGGNFGPYRQSERVPSYEKHIRKLLEIDAAYYCFCTEKELEEEREEQRKKEEVQRYSGKCREIPQEAAQERVGKEERAIIRLRIPEEHITFTDVVRGEITFDASLFGDIAIAKNLTTPLYNFAAVIDDAEMAITHVLRGEDHISNTPKQIVIARTLDLPSPHYGHFPLILGPDRSKLSKRHGATSVKEFREMGYLPEAMINFMALLGWNPGTEQELFIFAELVEAFSLDRVQKGGAVFNWQKLDWLNQQWQKRTVGKWLTPQGEDPLRDALEELLKEMGIPEEKRERAYLEKVLSLITQRLEGPRFLKERMSEFLFLFQEPKHDTALLAWKNMSSVEIQEALRRAKEVLMNIPEGEWTQENLEQVLLNEAKEWGRGDRGRLLWPLRVALSGQKTSPGPHEIAAVLGKRLVLERIDKAISLV